MSRWSPFDSDADRRLVRSLNHGDEDTIAALYDAYAEQLYDYSTSLVCEVKVAADIVHDCLIDASRRAPRMRDRVRLRSWLYGAARRRCLQRGRSGGLYWDWPDEPRSDDSAPGLPVEERRELLEATLSRLEFIEQEALLLALRHGMTGSDLGATLALSGRRASSRVSRARSRAQAAMTAELGAMSRRCADEDRSKARALDAADAARELSRHTAVESPPPVMAAATSPGAAAEGRVPECPACRDRERVTVTELLDFAPVPPLPVALRRRVLHTGTDPELAGYRADIAGRGGNLTAQGLPRQPDVPLPFTRRWLFAGGGVAGALLTAIVAIAIIGPDLPGPDIYWPSGPKPSISAVPDKPAAPSAPVISGPPEAPPPAAVAPAPNGHLTPPRPRPGGTIPLPRPGSLDIGPTDIRLSGGDRVAYIDLVASHGPVTWNAVPSSSQISISAEQGTIPRGGSTRLMVELERDIVEVEGEATITVTNAGNGPQTVTVSWSGSFG
jgi:RNA polymerase sigma factor (sigma-70 family)